MDDFENQLKRQPLRTLPAEWREEILRAASGNPKVESRAPKRFSSSPLVSRLSTIFWPHPKVWAGLATIWVLIFAIEFATSDHTEVVAKAPDPSSPQMVIALKQQQQLMAELIRGTGSPDVDRPKQMPQPRSDWKENFSFA